MPIERVSDWHTPHLGQVIKVNINNDELYWQYVPLMQCDEKWKWKSLSRVQLLVTRWTIQSIGFSRPEYWSGSPFTSPGILPNPGIKPRSPALQEDSLLSEPPESGRLFLLISLFPESLTPVLPWEKHQTNPSWGTFYKIPDQCTLKVLKSSKTRKSLYKLSQPRRPYRDITSKQNRVSWMGT